MDKKEQIKRLLGSASALLEAMRYSAATATGDASNVGRYSSYKMFLRKYNELAKTAAPLLTTATMLDLFDLSKIKGSWDLTWIDQKELFDQAYSNTALLKSLLEGTRRSGFAPAYGPFLKCGCPSLSTSPPRLNGKSLQSRRSW